MRKEYDFSKSKRNPYLKKLKKQISIRLDIDTIEYFKKLSEETGIPYQNLINTYLADCVTKKRKPELVSSLPVVSDSGLTVRARLFMSGGKLKRTSCSWDELAENCSSPSG